MAILETANVEKHFGGVRANQDISIKVEKGSITSIIGPNGAGKTTLFNLLTGLYKPDRGRITFDGTDITGWPIHKIVALGVARSFQILNIFTEISPFENIRLAVQSRKGMGFHFLRSTRKFPEINRETDSFAPRRHIGATKIVDDRDSGQAGKQGPVADLQCPALGRGMVDGLAMKADDGDVGGGEFGHLQQALNRPGMAFGQFLGDLQNGALAAEAGFEPGAKDRLIGFGQGRAETIDGPGVGADEGGVNAVAAGSAHQSDGPNTLPVAGAFLAFHAALPFAAQGLNHRRLCRPRVQIIGGFAAWV